MRTSVPWFITTFSLVIGKWFALRGYVWKALMLFHSVACCWARVLGLYQKIVIWKFRPSSWHTLPSALCQGCRIDQRGWLALTLLTFVREVSISRIGRDTGYPVWGISWCSSVPSSNAGIAFETSNFFIFSLLSLFWKIIGDLWDHLAVSVSLHPPPPFVDRQQLGEHVPAETNIHETIEELLDAVFSVRSVSYQILSM
jgi:hypothetical protein